MTTLVAATVSVDASMTPEELEALLLRLNERLAGAGMRVVGGGFCDAGADAPLPPPSAAGGAAGGPLLLLQAKERTVHAA